MTQATDLVRLLAQYLAGEFTNQQQAIANPSWFVNLRAWHRPLPMRMAGHLALFMEQANALYPDRPYRQRILIVQPTEQPDLIRGQFWGFQQPDRFARSGADPTQLQGLSPSDLTELPGCGLEIRWQGDRFVAEPPPDAKCCFPYEGQLRQVVLGFTVSASHYESRDRGVDMETGKGLWGALMGAYEYEKAIDFAAQLPV
jgi:hypothetical protein